MNDITLHVDKMKNNWNARRRNIESVFIETCAGVKDFFVTEENDALH